jgi:hypothetical protein
MYNHVTRNFWTSVGGPSSASTEDVAGGMFKVTGSRSGPWVSKQALERSLPATNQTYDGW